MLVKLEAGAVSAVNEQVYEMLRRSLMSGYFKPGQPISIRYLTETLGVSATPAREAIKRLQAEHALVIGPNRTPSVPVLTREDLRDLRDIRLALEGMATERAAEKKKEFGKEFISLARNVYKLNDQRAKIKLSINEALGSNIKEVKSHD